MNSVNLVGRLTRDPEIIYANSGTTVAKFSLAVDRRVKKEGEQTADFPNCTAFGRTAEFVERYFFKGMRMGISGRIQTGSYTNKDGIKVYTTDVVAENCEFVESKTASQGNNQVNQPASGFGQPDEDGFMNIPDGIDEELPFN